MKRATDILFLILVCALIFGIGGAIFILPANTFSQRENRPLAQFPPLSLPSLLDGSFFRSLSLFYTDQLPLRESLGEIYSISEIALGKRESNRVLLRSGTLITRTKGSREIYKYNLGAIGSFLEHQESSLFFCPPETAEVFSHLLSNSERGLLDAIPPQPNEISEEYLRVVRQIGAEGLYYRTDHHWTTEGAYEAYKLLCGTLGIEAYSKEHFYESVASESFLGSSYRRSSFPKSMISYDHIILYRYDGDDKFTVSTAGSTTAQQGFYRSEELGTSDEYRVFLGGNCAHASVTLDGATNRKRMLLVKDSFANSLLPFLALHYDIEMVDPRYADPSLIQRLCESQSFDVTLILVSKSTLLTDRSYGKALYK
ncbi:MAG: hypothetical protein IJW52_00175 [Clostridia bacterium]|nr:hypothetical protein [Clostridia bacterium]